jgi:hypothetical protein
MTAQAHDKEQLLNVLKFELAFLEAGGYGRYVRTPWQATSVFRDSPSCLNFNESTRVHPCHDCLLMEFVPPERRSDNVPCHQIVLNQEGETVDTLYLQDNQVKLEERLAQWLRATIQRLEADDAPKRA